MARLFLSLRLAELRNRVLEVRSNPRVRGSIALTAFLAVWLGAKYLPGAVRTLHDLGRSPDGGSALPMLAFSATLTWLLGPLAGFARGPFDVEDFRLLPLGPGPLARGILTGSALSPGLVVTAALVGTTLSGFTFASAGWVLVVLATLALLAVCLLAGRIVTLGVDVLSRQRRSRDLLLVATLPISLTPLLMLFEAARVIKDPAAGSPVTGVIRWLPLAWPGRAMAAASDGHLAEALVFLAASAALLVAGWLLVVQLTRWALLGDDRSHEAVRATAHPFDAFARWLPDSRRGAVAAAVLRGLARDSARIPQVMMGTLVVGGMFTAGGVALVMQSDASYAPLGAVGLALVPLVRRLNEFGTTGPALWMDVVTPGSARDELLGRDLAAVVVDGPVCAVVVTAVAIGTRTLAWLPAALVVVAAAVAVSYTVTRVTSVLFASGDAAAKDAMRSGGDRDPRSAGLQLGAIVGLAVAGAPIIEAVVQIVQRDGSWAVPMVLAVAVYGAVVYGAGLRFVTHWLEGNEPVLLAKVGG